MNNETARISDIPVVQTQIRWATQAAPLDAPFLEVSDFRLRRLPDLEIELEFSVGANQWIVAYLLTHEHGRMALANVGGFLNPLWELAAKRDESSTAFKAFAAACPMTAGLLTTGQAKVGDVVVGAAPKIVGDIAVVTVLFVVDQETQIGEILSIDDLNFMCDPILASNHLFAEVQAYYATVGQHHLAEKGAGAADWLKAGTVGVSTANEALKAIKRLMGSG